MKSFTIETSGTCHDDVDPTQLGTLLIKELARYQGVHKRSLYVKTEVRVLGEVATFVRGELFEGEGDDADPRD